MKRRVVITGIGAVTPCGVGSESLWKATTEGRSSADIISRFAPGDLGVHYACEISGFEATDYVGIRESRRLDRSAQLALCAAQLASDDAGLTKGDQGSAESRGVIDGSSLGTMASILDEHRCYLAGNSCKGGPHMLITGMTGSSSSAIATHLDCRGAAETYAMGSVSASTAIGRAFSCIQAGNLDVVFTGGTEAPIHRELMLPFAKAGVLSKATADPHSAFRPYALGRDGFVMGEGAVYLALEELDHAIARDARIYCELTGFAENCDSYSYAAPDPSGSGLARCIKLCCTHSSADLTEVGYVNLHGTATPANDSAESAAITELFGPREVQPWCGSTKPITGHLLGACGAVEAAIVALALYRQLIPPSANCEPQDPACEIKCPQKSVPFDKNKFALSCNSSFGGRNTVLSFKRYVTN